MAFVTLLSIAAYTDLRYRVIPNEACLGILWLGLVFNGYSDGTAGVASSIVGTLLCLGIFLPGYAITTTAAVAAPSSRYCLSLPIASWSINLRTRRKDGSAANFAFSSLIFVRA